MTVFVDDMYLYPLGQYRGMKMSHMIADTEDELHAMADQIGVSRTWYQGDHYDVCMSKRALAIKCGAVPITLRELGKMVVAKRRAAAS
jgi:Protein of unknown function (DUF4031)